MTNYSNDFKESIFKEVEEVKNVCLVARKHSIPQSTIHTWLRKRDVKIDFSILSEDSALRKENKKLKQRISEQEIENQILRDLLKKTYQIWNTDSKSQRST